MEISLDPVIMSYYWVICDICTHIQKVIFSFNLAADKDEVGRKRSDLINNSSSTDFNFVSNKCQFKVILHVDI